MSENYDILVPSDSFDFTKLSLANPTTLQGGTFFTKLLNDNSELYIQTPICTTKSGFVKTAKKINCDMLFEKNNTVFIEWFENLEEYCQKMIYAKSKEWFQDEIEQDDIESAFTSSIRSYKSGMFNMIKTSTESPRISHGNTRLSIFDQQEKELQMTDVTPNNNMVCILQLHGVKFTPKNFQILIQLKQVMVMSDNMFSKCQIRPNLEVKSKRKISLKSYVSEDADNEIDNDNDNDNHNEDNENEDNDSKEEISIALSTEDSSHNENSLLEDHPESLEESPILNKTTIEEIHLNLDRENLEEITLKNPNEVYMEIYREARNKAKEAKRQAIISYLELNKIKSESEYDMSSLDNSDDELDSAINTAIDKKRNNETHFLELEN